MRQRDGRPDDAPIVDSFRKAYNRLDSWNKVIRKNSPDFYDDFVAYFKINQR